MFLEKLKHLSFGQSDIDQQLQNLTLEEIDSLPFGVIEVDSLGTILKFNQTEAELAKKNKEEVIGKNFFNDIAPCAKTPEFYGKFLEGVKNKNLNVMFEYVFDSKNSATKVKVHMKRSTFNENIYYIFIKRLNSDFKLNQN